ncbi:MAG TPA: ribonuclease M5 [Acholeplasmataceae bacterium]|nr:ribonuclease M5 [Acholeplasmataceae bacterium]
MVVIVEGKNDYNKLKSVFPNLNILITNGSDVRPEFLELVKKLSQNHDIVLCLDPDYSGERIRKTIVDKVPNALHIYANRNKAISKNGKKIGIEHMSKENIISLFSDIKIVNNLGSLTLNDLYDLGLVGEDDSAIKRKELGNRLGIGYGNAKQFLKKLNMFNISKEDIKKVYDCTSN